MKKILMVMVSVLLILLSGLTAASAKGANCRRNVACNNNCQTCACCGENAWCGTVDADNDGVCDQRMGDSCAKCKNADGDGTCDCGKENCTCNGKCRNGCYVDADGDGVCDAAGNCGRAENGAGRKNGMRKGAGCRMNRNHRGGHGCGWRDSE